MPQNLLEQLRNYTTVVADTGDFEAIEKFPSYRRHHQSLPDHYRLADAPISRDCR